MRPLALVTGGGRGIGAGIAIELASRGFDIAIVDIDPQAGAGVLEKIAANGASARAWALDLGSVARHAAVLAEIVEWGGPVACLVNNAGIPAFRRGDLLDIAPESYDRVLDVNLRGTFFLTQAVARHMADTVCAHPRSIVTVSSVSAEAASIERGEYCVSKAGLAMLTKLFALRLAPHGIGVFEVRPGIIRTPMTEAVHAKYEARIAEGLVPVPRWGEPADVAAAVAALAGGQLLFSTGTVVHVDGGLSVPRL
jgi:NAD(P)-dependent dehydrogenase (short-subunit alcohol dehydrogenase family)